MRRRVAATALTVCLVGACGGAGAGDPSSGPPSRGCEPVDVTVGLEQSGSLVRLCVGGSLVVNLGPAGPEWSLVGWPDDVLRLEGPARGRTFSLVAVAAGTGQVDAIARDCPPPMPGATATPDCPTGGAPDGGDGDGLDPGARPPLAGAFTLEVVVVEA